MLTHPTIDQLRALKLDGMADAFIELEAQDRAKDLSHAEWLALLLDREAANRGTKRLQTRLRAARLRHGQASIEDVDYRAARRLDKALFQQLATSRWIVEHRNLLVTGPCGIGKSWLSCALAQKACRDGYTVYYARVPRLFADLELAHGDGRFSRLFRTLTKADLLILDDWGPDRLNPNQRRDLMEIVEDRYGAGATLITSQLPVEAWHEVIGEPTFAVDARSQDGQSGGHGARGRNDERDATQAGQGSQKMTAQLRIPPAPVGQQGPPTRAATSDSWRSLRVARGSLLLTGMASVALDERPKD
jgi:DNA replication protein DnaC